MRDLTFYALPMKGYLLERLAAGEFPWWAPHLSAGMPFFAELSNQVLYPLNLLFAWPPVEIPLLERSVRGLTAFCLTHSLLGLLAAYGLGRVLGLGRWVACWMAALYGLSGYVLSVTDNVNYLPATVWAPAGLAAWWGGARLGKPRWVAGLALCLALMVLAGDTFNPMVLGGACLLAIGFERSHWRASLLSLGVAGLCAGLLCLAQLLPTWELVKLSVRQVPLTFQEITLWSFPPQRLIEWVLPFFYGSKYPTPGFLGMFLYPEFREPWSDSVYLGLIPVLLAVTAVVGKLRSSRFWLTLLLISLTLSFGKFLPGYAELLKLIPPLQFHRYPEKWLLWPSLSLSVLAALGTQAVRDALTTPPRWLAWVQARPPWQQILGSLALLGLLVWVLVEIPATLWIWSHANERSVEWGEHTVDRVAHVQGLLLHTVGFLLPWLLLPWVRSPWRNRAVTGLMILALLDIGWQHGRHVPTTPTSLLIHRPPPAALEAMASHSPAGLSQALSSTMPRYRVYYDDWQVLMENTQNPILLKRIAHAYGLTTVPSESYPYHWVYKFLYNQERLLFNYGSLYQVGYLNGRFSPLQPLVHHQMDQVMLPYAPQLMMVLCGVQYIVTAITPENPQWASPNFTEIARDPDLNLRVLSVNGTLPAAYLVPNVLPNLDPQVYRILTPQFENYKSQAEIATLPSPHPEHAPLLSLQPATIEWLTQQPEHRAVRVTSPYSQQSFLIFTEGAYPGWHATVDGRPVDWVRANQRFMAVPVPPGRHIVRLDYSYSAESAAWAGSLLGLVLLLTLVALPSYRFARIGN
jgi:hypothetical protein